MHGRCIGFPHHGLDNNNNRAADEVLGGGTIPGLSSRRGLSSSPGGTGGTGGSTLCSAGPINKQSEWANLLPGTKAGPKAASMPPDLLNKVRRSSGCRKDESVTLKANLIYAGRLQVRRTV